MEPTYGIVTHADSSSIIVNDLHDIPPVGTHVLVSWTDDHVCPKLTQEQQERASLGIVEGQWIMQLLGRDGLWCDSFDIVACPFCGEKLP